MAVEGIGNLVQHLANQLFGETQDTQVVNSPRTVSTSSVAVTQDTFTPSTPDNSGPATAQDAGIFQVRHAERNAVTASILFEQKTANGSPSGAPADPVSARASNPGTSQAVAATSSPTPVNAVPQVADSRQAPATATTGNVDGQLRALNAALPVLGLTYAQIQQIDRIATLVHNFNPAAYANLVNQFEAVAQANATPAAPGASSTPPSTAGVAANGSVFQAQEVLINVTEPQPTPGAGAAKHNAVAGNGHPQTSETNQPAS